MKYLLLQRVHRETKCNAENGREVKAMDVFTYSIRYLKDHLLAEIFRSHLGDEVKVTDISFVLTVPAIWDDTAKMFMREAAIAVSFEFIFEVMNSNLCISLVT